MTDYSNILNYLNQKIGLNIDSIGFITLESSILNTMKEFNTNNINHLLDLIQNDYEKLRVLIENIKVPETWFFRDIESFNYLKLYIEKNRNQINKTNPLKILSAPCSTGEEPYSLAILTFECGLSRDEVEILAIDISRESLQSAQNAIYRKSSFRNDYNNFKEKYFVNIDGKYKLIEKIKNYVIFKEENILNNDFLYNYTQFNIIYCKNLLIYFNDDARNIVLNNINRLLDENGVLLVGLSELSFFTRNDYEQVKHNLAFACKKKINNTQNSDFTKNINYTEESINFKELNNKHIIKQSTNVKKIEKSIKIEDNRRVYTLENIKKLADEGNFKEAEEICKIILQNDNYNIEILFYMGLIYMALNKKELAIEYFNKVIYLAPSHYETLIHLSLIYESIEKKQQAEIFKKRAEKVFKKNIQN